MQTFGQELGRFSRYGEGTTSVRATGYREAAYLDSVVAGMLVLSELGISIAPILATAGAVVIRCRFKVLPLEQRGVRREFLRPRGHAAGPTASPAPEMIQRHIFRRYRELRPGADVEQCPLSL